MKTFNFSLIIIILLFFQNLHAQTPATNSVKSADKTASEEYPDIPEQLLNTEINLTKKGKKIRLADYKNDVIILSFVAEWAEPARRTISDLNKLYAENLEDLRIIAVSVADGKSEISSFKEFVKLSKIKFQTGFADKKFTEDFIEIAKFNGVPQSFVIKNGKLRGIFTGYSPKINESLMNLIRKISNE